jgi:chromosome segregation ATPase
MTERKEVLDDGYRAVALEVGDSLEKAKARIRELEAQLAEAKAELRDWVENRGPRLTAEEVNRHLAGTGERINTLTSALEECITQRDEADYRTGQAEARAQAMRAALEAIRDGRFKCVDKNCYASDVAQAALNPEPPPIKGETE